MEGPRLDRSPRDPAAPLARARIVVAVGGGIAAYKAAELVRLLDKAGAQVEVAMTSRAQKFVGPMTFQALTRRPVFTDLFSLADEGQIGHIQLADRADFVIVAPASGCTVACRSNSWPGRKRATIGSSLPLEKSSLGGTRRETRAAFASTAPSASAAATKTARRRGKQGRACMEIS